MSKQSAIKALKSMGFEERPRHQGKQFFQNERGSATIHEELGAVEIWQPFDAMPVLAAPVACSASLRQVMRLALDEIRFIDAHDNQTNARCKAGAISIMEAALSSTTAGQSLLDELQQLRQREAGLKSFLGVLAKEMEKFCEVTAFAPDALDAALNTMHRWQGLIEAACKGTEANHNG